MTMAPPTLSQQRGLAYGPKPLAALSFFSSAYVVHHLLFQQLQKRQRMYHRLVLAQNIAMLPLSLAYFTTTWPVPEGTPHYVGAVGNAQTCTAQGFISLMLAQTVPIYYASLGLQSFLNIRNKFNEERYVWIEKWIHLAAILFPCGLATIVAATENFNPSGSGCWLAKAPLGCEADPSVLCERGSDITIIVYIFGMGQLLLYFVIPPAAILAMFIWIKKMQKRTSNSSGMQLIREEVRREMNHNLAVQVSVYLFSFWGTFILNVIHTAYNILTGDMMYNLLILGNTVFSSQGLVLTIVYFTLEKLGKPKLEMTGVSQRITFNTMVSDTNQRGSQRITFNTMSSNVEQRLTVHDIRQLAAAKGEDNGLPNNRRKRLSFHIFDGSEPDPTSPWAKFIDPDDDEASECSNDAPSTIENESDHQANDDQV